mmetsp:Transcript_11389/g.24341  ORF Transcript_11389/g.24341 Transcript_11389/m.24341 type:complete len:310 (+) Transcript_11389:136-1065(+)
MRVCRRTGDSITSLSSIVLLLLRVASSVVSSATTATRLSPLLPHQYSLLTFIAAGERCSPIVSATTARLQRVTGSDVFLSIYDGSVSPWHSLHSPPRVRVANCSLGKFQCILKLRLAQIPLSYTHLWILDENVLLPQSDQALAAFARPPADILMQGPSIKESRLPYMRPDRRCVGNGTHATIVRGDFVEICAPLIRLEIIEEMMRALRFSASNRTDWGIDKFWCRWAAMTYALKHSSVCAVVHPHTPEDTFIKTRAFGKSQFASAARWREATSDLKHSFRINPPSWRSRCHREAAASVPKACSAARIRC